MTMNTATVKIEVPNTGLVEVPVFVTEGFARAYHASVTGATYDMSGSSPRSEGIIDAFCRVVGFDPGDPEHRDEVSWYLGDLGAEIEQDEQEGWR